jgi:transcriptional regulator with XRE-family HTH domain
MAPQRPPADFGSKLREARERRGLSLRQIANATKISVPTLDALEKGDIKRLPGGIFSRAFVRAFAAEVGLDPERTIQDFIAQFPQESVTAGHPTTSRDVDEEAVESQQRAASTVLRLAGISVPIAAVVIYIATAGRPVRQPVKAAAPVASQTSESATARTEPTSSARADEPKAVAGDDSVPETRLTVEVTTTRASWVSAVVDGERTLDQLLQPGDARRLDVRRELVLTAADGGAIALSLNGTPARPLGPAGQSVTARLNPTNFKDYLPVQ